MEYSHNDQNVFFPPDKDRGSERDKTQIVDSDENTVVKTVESDNKNLVSQIQQSPLQEVVNTSDRSASRFNVQSKSFPTTSQWRASLRRATPCNLSERPTYPTWKDKSCSDSAETWHCVYEDLEKMVERAEDDVSEEDAVIKQGEAEFSTMQSCSANKRQGVEHRIQKVDSHIEQEIILEEEQHALKLRCMEVEDAVGKLQAQCEHVTKNIDELLHHLHGA